MFQVAKIHILTRKYVLFPLHKCANQAPGDPAGHAPGIDRAHRLIRGKT